MPEKIFHIFALVAVIALCLMGEDRATFCVADGEWNLHRETSQSIGQPAGCAVPLAFDDQHGLSCGDGDCSDVEIRGVVKRPASPREGVEAPALSAHLVWSYFVAVPWPGEASVSGGAWSVLHAPPRPSIADTVGVRQI